MYNLFVGIGRLAKDPETRFTPGGTEVCEFRLAIDRKPQEGADFFNVVSFGKLAEVCSQYLKKGMLVMIEGRVRLESWQKEGKWHNATKIMCSTVKFLEKKGKEVSDEMREKAQESQSDEVPF